MPTTLNRPAKSARKPQPRACRLLAAPRAGRVGLLSITEGAKFDIYSVIPLSLGEGYPDASAAYRLEKHVDHGAEPCVYDVLFDGRGKASCDCRGHVRYGYCRHSSALTALIAKGRLPLAADQSHVADAQEAV
jgi:hypothetical protein